jgi:sugar lactone lactonase YvrE
LCVRIDQAGNVNAVSGYGSTRDGRALADTSPENVSCDKDGTIVATDPDGDQWSGQARDAEPGGWVWLTRIPPDGPHRRH